MVRPMSFQPVPPGPALDLLEKIADFSEDITNASEQVVPANKARTALFVVNDSDTIIYVTFGRGATVNTGIRLNAAGGALEINKQNLIRSAMYAIAAAAGTKRLTVLELESRYAY